MSEGQDLAIRAMMAGRTNEEQRQVEAVNRQARYFDTGATRDTDEGKLDFDGFLSPLALRRFAEYMHECRKQSDGKLRDSDNWQKGIPQSVYRKSMWRHFFAVWEKSRRGEQCITDLCALLFNVQGMLHEQIKEKSS
jgi:hypothetical protein